MTESLVPEPEPAPGDLQTAGPPAASVSTAQPPRCPTRTRLYRRGRVLAEGFPAQDIAGHLDGEPQAVVWLDLLDPDEADLQIVTEEFGLHPLAVEDAIQDHQRPKLDRYRTHLFANVYAAEVEISESAVGLTTTEISAFLTPRALITVRKADFDVDTLIARWDLDADLADEPGIGFLVYGLLDALVDGHNEAFQRLDDAMDALEDNLFEPRSTTADVRRRGFELRKTLAELRRVVAPMSEVVGRLMRGDAHVVGEKLMPYFQDVYDHVLRVSDNLDGARDRISSILEANLNEQSNQLNEITKKLAAWAAIIAVPTAVTGFYGQNVPYPGFDRHWGFVVSTLVILVFAGGLYVLLKRNKWL